MRVGIDVRVVDPTAPGQQRYLWRLGTWLSRQGHDTHFLTVRSEGGLHRYHSRLALHRLGGTRRPLRHDYIRKLDLDVLLLNPERSRAYHGIGANVLRAAYGTEHYRQKLRSFRSTRSRAVRSFLRTMPWVTRARRVERHFYEGTSSYPLVIAQSRYMKEEVVSSYSIPARHVRVIPNPVDTSEFNVEARHNLRADARSRWSISEDSTCLAFIGHNFRLKGLWTLLDAVAKVDDPALHILVAGKGTGPSQVREAHRRIRRLGLSHRVTLAGPVSHSIHALAAADIVGHLTWHDSFGFVVLEAMATGLPVVTTPYAGASELIEPETTGLVVDPGQPADVAHTISRLLDPELRSRIGTAAAAMAPQHDELLHFPHVERIMEEAVEHTTRSAPGDAPCSP